MPSQAHVCPHAHRTPLPLSPSQRPTTRTTGEPGAHPHLPLTTLGAGGRPLWGCAHPSFKMVLVQLLEIHWPEQPRGAGLTGGAQVRPVTEGAGSGRRPRVGWEGGKRASNGHTLTRVTSTSFSSPSKLPG